MVKMYLIYTQFKIFKTNKLDLIVFFNVYFISLSEIV